MTNQEQVVVTQGGMTKDTTTSGIDSKNVNCKEIHYNNGATFIFSDQANTIILKKDCHFGCKSNLISQINGDQCLIVEGKSENRFEGSHYKIVGNTETYAFHVAGALDELNSNVIAYRSGFGDDRNDPTAALKPPSIGMDPSKIASSVTNQTNSDVNLPDPPKRTGDILRDHAAALAYDATCTAIIAEQTVEHQLYQQTIGKLELMYERVKMIFEHIDDIDCDPEVKEQIRKAKKGNILAMASLPGTVIEVLMSKIAHDLSKKDTFDRDAYYQAIAENEEKRSKLEAMC